MWPKTNSALSLSIRTRLTIFYASLMTITIIISSFLFYNTLSIRLYNTVDHEIEEQISEFSQAANDDIELEKDLPLFTKNFLANHTLRPGEIIIIRTNNEQIITSSKQKLIQDILTNKSFNQNYININKIETFSTKNLGKIRIATTSINLDNKIIGILQIALPLNQTEKILNDALRITIIISITSLILVSIIGYFVAGKALNPLRQISNTVQQITRKNLKSRIKTNGSRDEIGDLAISFNEMIERLDFAFTQQKQFISDASHELRTPLTIAKGNLEVLKKLKTLKGKDFDEMIDISLDELDRMNRLINDLLILARSNQEDFVKFQNVNLQEIIGEVSLKAKSLVNSNFKIINNTSIDVKIDKDKLTQAILNLIQNASNYTPEDGLITIETKKLKNYVEIIITDTGIGIAEKELTHIFKRFYRVDEARSKEDGGSGLGLSIVKAIVDAHNGMVDVKSTPGKGSTFTIYLPLNGNSLKE